MTDTRAIAQDFLTRVASGDIDRIADLFTTDGTVRIDGSPHVPWLGEHTGHAAIREFYRTLFGHVTVHRFEVEKILTDDSDALILGELRDTVNATGAEFGFPFAIRLTIKDGKVERYHMFEDSYALDQALLPDPASA